MKRTRLVINGRKVRDQPPVVGDYCWPAASTLVDAPCFYKSAACNESYQTCARCGFSFCENHFRSHIKTMPPMPPDAWKSLMKRLRTGLEQIAKNPKSPLPAVDVVVSNATDD